MPGSQLDAANGKSLWTMKNAVCRVVTELDSMKWSHYMEKDQLTITDAGGVSATLTKCANNPSMVTKEESDRALATTRDSVVFLFHRWNHQIKAHVTSSYYMDRYMITFRYEDIVLVKNALSYDHLMGLVKNIRYDVIDWSSLLHQIASGH